MPQTPQPSSVPISSSGYITPIACKYCGAKAHLIQISFHQELDAELRTFECEECGKQTDLIVLREQVWHMPDIVIGFLVGCALGFGVGYGVREHVSRKRRRRYGERTG